MPLMTFPSAKGIASGILTAVLASVLALISAEASAETIFVKYRGLVDLAPFSCQTVTRSSLIRRVCYDSREKYMIINLQGIYYHYCEIDSGTVNQLLGAESMGRFYIAVIKGRFDCRTGRVPTY